MADIKMSKAVANRIRTGDYLVASVETQGVNVAASLREVFGELTALELNPSQIQPFIKALASTLRAATRELEAKELAYLAELADDEGPRAVRDEQAAEAAELLQRTRELVRGALGDKGLHTYGLDAPLTRAPQELGDRLQTTVKLLRDTPTSATDPIGVVFDSAKVAEKLEQLSNPLQSSIATLAREEEERVVALGDRDAAVEAWSGIYRGVATTLTGLYRLAGYESLADQLAPTEAKASGLV